MGDNVAFSLADLNLTEIESLAGKVNTAIGSVEQVLADIEPVENLLPLPSSVKTALADLESYLKVAQAFLSKVST
jgi:hypothetical protein